MHLYRCTECSLMRCDEPHVACAECIENLRAKIGARNKVAKQGTPDVKMTFNIQTAPAQSRPGVTLGLLSKYPLMNKSYQDAAEEILHWLYYNVGTQGTFLHTQDPTFWKNLYVRLQKVYNGAAP